MTLHEVGAFRMIGWFRFARAVAWCFVVWVTALFSCGCQDAPVMQAPGEPCGLGVQCVEQGASGLVPTGMCCGQGDVCGGSFPNVGCPTGDCCHEGLEARGDGGAYVVVGQQRPAR